MAVELRIIQFVSDMDSKRLSDVSTVRVLTSNAVLLWQTVVHHLQGWNLLQLPEQVKMSAGSVEGERWVKRCRRG